MISEVIISISDVINLFWFTKINIKIVLFCLKMINDIINSIYDIINVVLFINNSKNDIFAK